jgi:hypothetical protein
MALPAGQQWEPVAAPRGVHGQAGY